MFDIFASVTSGGLRDNREHIAAIISSAARVNIKALQGKVFETDAPLALQTLKLLGLKKPFFSSADDFILTSFLTYPAVFSAGALGIELSLDYPECGNFCWDGTGGFKQREALRAMEALGMGSASDGVILEVNIETIFARLEPFLERTAERMPWDK